MRRGCVYIYGSPSESRCKRYKLISRRGLEGDARAGGVWGGRIPPSNFPRVRETSLLCRLAMFSLFDLESLCADEVKLRAFLTKYGVLRDKDKCSCGGSFGQWCSDRGSSYRNCLTCGRKTYGKASTLLEGGNLTLKKWLYLAFYWAHNSAGERAVNMLGLGPP